MLNSSPKALPQRAHYITELFHLAEEQRYAHEYGDSCGSGRTSAELTAPSCLHDSSEKELPQEQSSQAKTKQPNENKTHRCQDSHFVQKCQSESPGDLRMSCASRFINPAQNVKDTQANEDENNKMVTQAPRMNLKT